MSVHSGKDEYLKVSARDQKNVSQELSSESSEYRLFIESLGKFTRLIWFIFLSMKVRCTVVARVSMRRMNGAGKFHPQANFSFSITVGIFFNQKTIGAHAIETNNKRVYFTTKKADIESNQTQQHTVFLHQGIHHKTKTESGLYVIVNHDNLVPSKLGLADEKRVGSSPKMARKRGR